MLFQVGFVALLAVLIIFQAISLRDLSRRVGLLEFDEQIRWVKESLGSPVSLDSNVIQFLNRGYSIQFEQVAYEPAGLHLKDYFGNPTNIFLHSVGLKFSARKNESLEDYRKAPGSSSGGLILFWEPEEIGGAQSPAIEIVLPGSRAGLEVSIHPAEDRSMGGRD